MKIVNGIQVETTDDELAQMVIDAAAHEIAVKQAQIDNVNNNILRQLKDLDAKTIRAIRTNDQTRIAALEAEAAELRKGLIK